MTPQEKAKELFNKFKYWNDSYIKECALIAVDEVLENNPFNKLTGGFVSSKDFWLQVKEEINKL